MGSNVFTHPGTRNYQEVGAVRLKVSTIWKLEGVSPRFSTDGEFYPIYNIENGVLVEHSPPPQANIITAALARYDRKANGSYVVKGLEVMFLQKGENGWEIMISEGKAHVIGLVVFRKFGFSIDLKNNLLKISDQEISLAGPYYEAKALKIVTKEDVHIPPRREAVINEQFISPPEAP